VEEGGDRDRTAFSCKCIADTTHHTHARVRARAHTHTNYLVTIDREL